MPVGGIHRYSAVFTAHTAQLKFGGSYTTVNFNLTNDGHGGTLIKDPPAASPANVALFGNYIAAGFPVPAATPARPCSPATKRLLSRWRSQGTGAEARWFLVDSEGAIARRPAGDEAIHYFPPIWIASRSRSSGRPLRAGSVGSQ
jgi:hypothetical protein